MSINMDNMNLLDDFQNEFRAQVKHPSKGSGQQRMDSFDKAMYVVNGGSEEFPKYKELYGYFAKCMTNKKSWGSKETVKKLLYSINAVYYKN